MLRTLTILSLITLTACSTARRIDGDGVFGAQYWQRVSTSDAIYQQGPKAQQMLSRDIARCVSELRELERLGVLRDVIPASKGKPQLEKWDTPERDGALLAEHSNYHDFESCMLAKGWERIEHVPYDVATEGRNNYLKAIGEYKYQSTIAPHHRQKSDDYNQ